MTNQIPFDAHCRSCPRLAAFLDQVKVRFPTYHAQPVAPFGDPQARLLIVGLAPGLHGANATGRPFTGDHAGILLYRTLHQFGFANRPESRHLKDGLHLLDCRITNAVKCLPPQNKPTGPEIRQCNRYLSVELGGLKAGSVVVALGAIAHRAILQALGQKLSTASFGHANEYRLDQGVRLIDSYHCSRYNTQTGRLTDAMFEAVFARVRVLFDEG